ncbi:coproporphyrinogen-III oxidase family protein [Nocardia takedensis]|uniref:coproporphyrinogen-III oxidase family protein n=1 Tax=Nocardia takedensis TaxID=259390 RepID=UPI00030A8682|nr:radical SAM protein [Nocardia takedensis]
MLPFESFSYPFFDLNTVADHRGIVSAFLDHTDPQVVGDHATGRRALYVHIPFCETICRFCPFVKSVGSTERVNAYLTALFVELRTLGATPRMAGWEIDSVYIGGGTPSVLSIEQITALMREIRVNFQISADAEISFEFEAKSVDPEKFAALAELGITRVSFGVQSFDPVIREQVNITATLDQVHDAINWASDYFVNTNLDMMVGFPGQDRDHAHADARAAASSGIGSVSIYPVDYVMTLPGWQNRIRSGELPRPENLDERSRMFHVARAALGESMGEQNMYCFGPPQAPATRYMFSTLYGGYRDEAVGVGAGAYSFLRGVAWMNEADERAYVAAAGAGGLPITRSSPGHAYEKGLVFFPKRLSFDMRDLPLLGLEQVYADRIEAVVAAGHAEIAGDILALTEAGKLVYSELMAHFFSDAQARIYQRMVARLSREVGVIDEIEWQAGTDRVSAMGAANALPGASSRRRRLPLVGTPR